MFAHVCICVYVPKDYAVYCALVTFARACVYVSMCVSVYVCMCSRASLEQSDQISCHLAHTHDQISCHLAESWHHSCTCMCVSVSVCTCVCARWQENCSVRSRDQPERHDFSRVCVYVCMCDVAGTRFYLLLRCTSVTTLSRVCIKCMYVCRWWRRF